MTIATRMDGSALAKKVRARIGRRVQELASSSPRPPCLAVVLVGSDPASQIYVRNKHRACEEVGIESRRIELADTTSPSQLEEVVRSLNADPGVDGVLVQLPLPAPLDADRVRTWIDPRKDVDGLHPESLGLLASGTPRFVPCTPAGCLELLREYEVPLAGHRAVVIGRSLIVGRPLAILLSTPGVDATVTTCHSRTRDLPAVCREADILIAAAGKPGLVTADFVRPGATVIDVGTNRVSDPTRKSGARLLGDVDPAVTEVAGRLSPVPGGVGPMTIAMLLSNTVQAREAGLA